MLQCKRVLRRRPSASHTTPRTSVRTTCCISWGCWPPSAPCSKRPSRRSSTTRPADFSPTSPGTRPTRRSSSRTRSSPTWSPSSSTSPSPSSSSTASSPSATSQPAPTSSPSALICKLRLTKGSSTLSSTYSITTTRTKILLTSTLHSHLPTSPSTTPLTPKFSRNLRSRLSTRTLCWETTQESSRI